MRQIKQQWYNCSLNMGTPPLQNYRTEWEKLPQPACVLATLSQLLDVGDVVPRVAVEGLLQPQLVEVVADEADGTAQHKETIEAPKRHQFVTLLRALLYFGHESRI